MRRLILFLCLALALPAALLQAEMKEANIVYRHGDVTLEGYLVYETPVKDKKPGVLIIHQWTGLGDHERKAARRLAQMGYVAMAVDVYGQGVRPSWEKAGEISSIYKKDRELLRGRLQAALDTLKTQTVTDPNRIGVMGYCFGGMAALEMARAGADVKAAVSFHGDLSDTNPDETKKVKADVLILHGAADPLIPISDIEAITKNLNESPARWKMVSWGDAKHSFTEPSADQRGMDAVGYNAIADGESWVEMANWFARALNNQKR